jgi:hypothetical protein
MAQTAPPFSAPTAGDSPWAFSWSLPRTWLDATTRKNYRTTLGKKQLNALAQPALIEARSDEFSHSARARSEAVDPAPTEIESSDCTSESWMLIDEKDQVDSADGGADR